MSKKVTYADAIEKVMLENSYFASLKQLYKEIWKYKDRSEITGKTPDNTIQEKVQRDKRFTKIGLGFYALADKIHLLKEDIFPRGKKERLQKNHREIQGMLLEIGNARKEVHGTYTRDKNALYHNKETLGTLSTLQTVPPFTYKKIIKESVNFADVIWFNERGFPLKIFEVEHSTDFRDSFIKFMELQDFLTEFICISGQERKNKFDRELAKNAFYPIKKRVKFYSYKQVENDYNASLAKVYI